MTSQKNGFDDQILNGFSSLPRHMLTQDTKQEIRQYLRVVKGASPRRGTPRWPAGSLSGVAGVLLIAAGYLGYHNHLGHHRVAANTAAQPNYARATVTLPLSSVMTHIQQDFTVLEVDQIPYIDDQSGVITFDPNSAPASTSENNLAWNQFFQQVGTIENDIQLASKDVNHANLTMAAQQALSEDLQNMESLLWIATIPSNRNQTGAHAIAYAEQMEADMMSCLDPTQGRHYSVTRIAGFTPGYQPIDKFIEKNAVQALPFHSVTIPGPIGVSSGR